MGFGWKDFAKFYVTSVCLQHLVIVLEMLPLCFVYVQIIQI